MNHFYRIDASGHFVTVDDDEVVTTALCIEDGKFRRTEQQLSNPMAVSNYLRLKFAALEHEIFAMILLNVHHYVIDLVELFRGTIDGTSVYPREVLKVALARNAAAVILVHNHPSGVAEPSAADRMITARLKEALALIDVRVLDHLIVGHGSVVSFAERGLL